MRLHNDSHIQKTVHAVLSLRHLRPAHVHPSDRIKGRHGPRQGDCGGEKPHSEGNAARISDRHAKRARRLRLSDMYVLVFSAPCRPSTERRRPAGARSEVRARLGVGHSSHTLARLSQASRKVRERVFAACVDCRSLIQDMRAGKDFSAFVGSRVAAEDRR